MQKPYQTSSIRQRRSNQCHHDTHRRSHTSTTKLNKHPIAQVYRIGTNRKPIKSPREHTNNIPCTNARQAPSTKSTSQGNQRHRNRIQRSATTPDSRRTARYFKNPNLGVKERWTVDADVPATLTNKHCRLNRLVNHNNVTRIRITLSAHLNHAITIGVVHTSLTGSSVFLTHFHHRTRTITRVGGPGVIGVCSSKRRLISSRDNSTRHLPCVIVRCIGNRALHSVVGIGNTLDRHSYRRIVLNILGTLSCSRHVNVVRHSVGPNGVVVSRRNIIGIVSFNVTHTLSSSTTAVARSRNIINATRCLSPRRTHNRAISVHSSLCSTNYILCRVLANHPPFANSSTITVTCRRISRITAPPSTIIPKLPGV